jgi:hypothetical protein
MAYEAGRTRGREERATCKALKSHLMRAKNVTGPKKGSSGQLATRDRIPRGRREAVERQATGGALFDKIEFDRSRSVRCPIPISVRRGEYPPRFRSTRCIMFARCRARRASTSLYPIASYGEISVCIPLSLLQMGRVCYSERVQITFGGKTGAARFSLNLLKAQIARCFATECAEARSRVGLQL